MVRKSVDLFLRAGIVCVDVDGRPSPIRASSWRAGGARSATKIGLAGPMIMALGRWRSIAWGAYVAYSVADLESAAQKMWSGSSPSASSAVAPESAPRVGVPPRFQDDVLDATALQCLVAYRRIDNSRHPASVGSASRQAESRQCG